MYDRFLIPGLMLFILTGVTGCGKSSATASSPERAPRPAPAIIQAPGFYAINGGRDALSINDAPAGALGYQLGSSDDIELNGHGLISDRKKPWFFHNDSEGQVWSYVDSFGVVRWTKTEGSGWEALIVEEGAREVVEDIPAPFYDRLPEELKANWDGFRG